MLELSFRADRDSSEPVYRQLESFLRELIQTRRLRPGERLPASRDLARDLGLGRNTVSQAYQALAEDGLLRAHVGRGTFVAAGAGAPRLRSLSAGAPRGFAWTGLFARRTRAFSLPPVFRNEARRAGVRFDLRAGQVDRDSLPVAELRRAFGRALSDDLTGILDARDARGWPPLREAIARSLLARGIDCDADSVAVVNGAQQALDAVARVLVEPGDAVAMEQPGYFGAAFAFRACEAHVLPVNVDGEGLCTDELARTLRARRVKLVYTTPAVQAPTGVVMSEARRRQLLALADEYQVPVVEDDYDSELRYGGPPVPALKNLDAAGQVIYVGTFSKALFTGLRVGYVVAPPPLLSRLVLARWASDFNTGLVGQAALAHLLAGGGLERHVRRVRRIYAERRSELLAALASHWPETGSWVEPVGGNCVWVTLPPDVDPDQLDRESRERGIATTRGDVFHIDGSPSRSLCLSFGRLTREEIGPAVRELVAVIGRVRARRGADRRAS